MEFHPLSEFQEDTCISAYIVAGHGLVAVTELGQVSIHSFTQFAQNMESTSKNTTTKYQHYDHITLNRPCGCQNQNVLQNMYESFESHTVVLSLNTQKQR